MRQSRKFLLLLSSLLASILLLICFPAFFLNTNSNINRRRTTWVSLSVCWADEEDAFPHSYAGALSSRLWIARTDYSVVVYVVYGEGDRDSRGLAEYAEGLREGGGGGRMLVRMVASGEKRLFYAV
jgi:hypothetical protein